MRLFNQITLRTPESVELEFTLAGIGNRAYALFIDYNLLGLVLILFWLLWALVVTQLLGYLELLNSESGFNYSGLPNWLWAIALLTTFALFVGYFVLFETLWQGQTPGKRIAHIRVIRDDGRPARLAQATLRALLRPIDDILSLGVFLIAFGNREKRVGDWVAGTLVVQDVRPLVKRSLVLSDQAEAIATRLHQEAQVFQLTPDDFVVIRDYLHRRSLMDAGARSELGYTLARQVKEIITLEQLPQNMTPDMFLEATYLAYQQEP